MFPDNTAFISDMSGEHVALLRRLGWKIGAVSFLEIPYWVSYVEPLEPSMVGTYLVPDFKRGTYYRVLQMTNGWLDHANTEEIEDDIIHEQEELSDLEEQWTVGDLRALEYSRETYLTKETALQLRTRFIDRKNDLNKADQLLVDSLKVIAKIQRDCPCILSNCLFVWLIKHFVSCPAESLEIHMPERMRSTELERRTQDVIDWIMHWHLQLFGKRPF